MVFFIQYNPFQHIIDAVVLNCMDMHFILLDRSFFSLQISLQHLRNTIRQSQTESTTGNIR